MRLLFLGDVVGRSGRDAVAERLPGLIARYGFDFVVVNGENASHGKGLIETHFQGLRDAGADIVTLGDHAFDQREALRLSGQFHILLSDLADNGVLAVYLRNLICRSALVIATYSDALANATR